MLYAVRHRLLPGLVVATVLAATASLVRAEDIDPNNNNSQFAWGENLGWINAEPGGPAGPGVDVAFNELTGYMYGENIGWINLNCKNNNTCATVPFGVTNDGAGKLGGYAWGENVGWISFCDQDTPNTCKTTGSEYRVVIDPLEGIFSGYAWGENVGWISFGDTAPMAYQVQMSDGDTVPGGSDNCPFDMNQTQVNIDNAPIASPALPPAGPPPSDISVANSDLQGDDCDMDDDNDGILDSHEAAGCNGSGTRSSTNADTDGDRARDGAECALGTNPNDAGSKPPAVANSDPDADGLSTTFETGIGSNPNDNDSDEDKIIDGVEYKGYSTSPTVANTDGDACRDNYEITSVDCNSFTTSTDLLLVALSFFQASRPNMDINKNGGVDASDLLIVALNFNPFSCT